MSTHAAKAEAGLDLDALNAITGAVESGAGLPEVVRAAARALEASLIVADRTGAVLATATLSPADERSLAKGSAGGGVEVLELRVADEPVGTIRMRARGVPGAALVRLVATLVASEVERVRAPQRASAEALTTFVRSLLARELATREDILDGAARLGLDLEAGATILVVRAHSHVPAEDGWRVRVLSVAERGARAVIPGSVAILADRPDAPWVEIVVLVPGVDDAGSRRVTDGMLRELQTGQPGHTFAVGRSRPASDPTDLHRAGNEALLAANVAEGDAERPALAFEETGAYRLLLSAMSEDPAELQRFYAETVEPLVAYDGQYETDLVNTVEAFLDADGNVAATSQRLFTHRHTVRYRLERVRELSGLDVGSTDGREKLSLGLKAMRVLGIANRGGPASEAGAEAGRVPRR